MAEAGCVRSDFRRRARSKSHFASGWHCGYRGFQHSPSVGRRTTCSLYTDATRPARIATIPKNLLSVFQIVLLKLAILSVTAVFLECSDFFDLEKSQCRLVQESIGY